MNFTLLSRAVICSLWVSFSASAQQGAGWNEMFLTDTSDYVFYRDASAANSGYPASHLFDGDVSTCWVCGGRAGQDISVLFVRLPESGPFVLNVFAGYGKSRDLFFKNARPASLALSLYAAVNPDGYVTEQGALYVTKRYPRDRIVTIADTFGVQTLQFNLVTDDVSRFRADVRARYDREYTIPKADSCLILGITIGATVPGTRYSDVCISELFFNDRLVSAARNAPAIQNLYLNTAEDTLLMDTDRLSRIPLYGDPGAVLSIAESASHSRWAILMSMPREAEGRVETVYRLVDCAARSDCTRALERCSGDYTSGMALSFKTDTSGRLYAVYETPHLRQRRIELLPR